MDTSTLTVTRQVTELQPGEFPDWLARRQQALERILEAVKQQVGDETVEPLVGARIASCVAGSVFGYEEFHPRQGQPSGEQFLDALGIARS